MGGGRKEMKFSGEQRGMGNRCGYSLVLEKTRYLVDLLARTFPGVCFASSVNSRLVETLHPNETLSELELQALVCSLFNYRIPGPNGGGFPSLGWGFNEQPFAHSNSLFATNCKRSTHE